MLDTFVIPSGPTDGATESIKPELRVLDATDTYCKVVMEPLQRGYGITVGNPLRRVLLSSIKGSAITWIKIEDAVHEYTTIPGVKEEVMELLLNIKRIRIRSQAARTGRLRLEVSGDGRVCAGDIATSSDFEIINPELHLATLDSKKSNLSIEFNVEQGQGYQPATQSEGAASTLPVGVLPVDAIFNPIRKVEYNVERTRVGQVTDYERLVLEVWSDGTITPLEAVKQAANTLVNHFFLYGKLDRLEDPAVPRPPVSVSPEIYQTPIEKLGLSPRTLNCLKRAHIAKVGEVLEMSNDDLLKIRNFGEKSLEELHRKLGELGVQQHAASAGEAAEAQPATEAEEEPEEIPEDEPTGDLESLGAALRSSASRRRGAAAAKEDP
jgi:DNA-directed RNA polymerase subunit alpha